MLRQVGDLFELNVKLRCQNVKAAESCIARGADPNVDSDLNTAIKVFC